MNRYCIETMDESMVAKWANISISDVGDLEYTAYLQYLRDAFIYQMNQTEEGRKYLDDAWLLEQTEPDREASRAFSK